MQCFRVSACCLVQRVVIVLRNSSLADYSALEAINAVKKEYQERGKEARVKVTTHHRTTHPPTTHSVRGMDGCMFDRRV